MDHDNEVWSASVPEGAPQPPEPGYDSTAASDRPARRGSARERHERRKRQRVEGRSVSLPKPQLRAPGEIRMPEITVPQNVRLIVGAVGAVLFVVLIVAFLGALRGDPPQSFPNALWIGTEYTYEALTDEAVTALADQLREHHIGRLYAWVSWLQPDNTWRGEDNFENVKAFVTALRTAYPEVELHGWIGLPTEIDGASRIGDAELQKQIAQFSARVVDEFGFDGVFLNAEPVWNGDENYLALLRTVRAEVGIDTPISTAIPPDWSPLNATIPVPPLITPGTEWSTEYKQSVALLVDEMAVMAYSSGLSTTDDYAQWVAYQVEVFARAVAELGTDTRVMIGVPTYDAEPPGHDPLVENIDSAVAGVKLGLTRAGEAAEYVGGLAIYAGWTTEAEEWSAFRQSWVDG